MIMKKFFIIFLVVFFVVLTGCSGSGSFREEVTCEDIMNAVVEVTEHPDSDKIYKKSKNNLDTFGLSLWADGMYQECSDIELIDDYAIFVSAGTITYEVAVLKTKDNGSVNKLEDLMERRKLTLELGDKGMYDPKFDMRISSSKLQKTGNFVLLIITDNNDAALAAIEKLK